MRISVIGINHKTAPIEVREKFYFNPLQQELLLSEMRSHPVISESLVLSTCNRTEVYSLASQEAVNEILKIIFSIKKIQWSESFKKHFYVYEEKEAIQHLFRVTASLDSLVLGEKQILGQVKEAIELARKKGMFGKYFNILSNIAIRTAKKAHTETQISLGGASISWAAVTMAEGLLGALDNKSVLMIGAGKMSELATDQMKRKKIGELFIMNRTESCAMALAERYAGSAVSFSDIKEVLGRVDLCICSVSAPHYILEKNTVEKVMVTRQNRKLLFIDISMPRNIDPGVNDIPNVSLFYIDDLDRVVTENMKKRQAAIGKVNEIIEKKTSAFYQKVHAIRSDERSDYFEKSVRD